MFNYFTIDGLLLDEHSYPKKTTYKALHKEHYTNTVYGLPLLLKLLQIFTAWTSHAIGSIPLRFCSMLTGLHVHGVNLHITKVFYWIRIQ